MADSEQKAQISAPHLVARSNCPLDERRKFFLDRQAIGQPQPAPRARAPAEGRSVPRAGGRKWIGRQEREGACIGDAQAQACGRGEREGKREWAGRG